MQNDIRDVEKVMVCGHQVNVVYWPESKQIDFLFPVEVKWDKAFRKALKALLPEGYKLGRVKRDKNIYNQTLCYVEATI